MVMVGLVPLISVFNYSFHDIFTLQNLHWVGATGTARLIRSPRFWGSLLRSLLFSAIVLVGAVAARHLHCLAADQALTLAAPWC